MEKLLNERLREWGSAAFAVNNARSYYGEDDGRVNSMGRVFKKMADEIERFYIPRPRFEDGEPVQFGDEVFSEANEKINKPDEQYTVKGMRFYEGFMRFDNAMSQTINFVSVREGGFVKRPTSKVRDAGCVIICKGDTVWDVDSGEELTVQGFANMECGLVQCCNADGACEDHDAHNLVHEKPVFDADGERIKVGDTVYSLLNDGEEPFGTCYVVTAIDASRELPVSCGHWGQQEWLFKGASLTNREPDPLEQRCQQLEEAAREMLGCVLGHRYWPLRHKLEALGVNLDD